MKVTILTVPKKEMKKAVALVFDHPVMDESSVTLQDQKSVVSMLKENNCLKVAEILENFDLNEFEDFLVNECGED